MTRDQSDALNKLESRVEYLDFWNSPRPNGKSKIMTTKEKMEELAAFLKGIDIGFQMMEGTVQE